MDWPRGHVGDTARYRRFRGGCENQSVGLSQTLLRYRYLVEWLWAPVIQRRQGRLEEGFLALGVVDAVAWARWATSPSGNGLRPRTGHRSGYRFIDHWLCRAGSSRTCARRSPCLARLSWHCQEEGSSFRQTIMVAQCKETRRLIISMFLACLKAIGG